MNESTEPLGALTKDKLLDMFASEQTYDAVGCGERFMVHVPELAGDSILLPNIKEMDISLVGRDGKIDSKRHEARPLDIKTDGSQVIVIGGMDKYKAMGLEEKWKDLCEEYSEVSREMIMDFMSYATGYTYNEETHVAHLRSDRFVISGDVYHFHKNALAHYDKMADSISEEYTGHYQKRQAPTKLVFIDGQFEGQIVPSEKGGSRQFFAHGAVATFREDDKRLTLIDPVNLWDCYENKDGSKIDTDTLSKVRFGKEIDRTPRKGRIGSQPPAMYLPHEFTISRGTGPSIPIMP